jgi:tannase
MAASMTMPALYWLSALAASSPAGLTDVCNPTYVASVLPPAGIITGIAPAVDSVKANVVTNYTAPPSSSNPGKTGLDFCNVTFSYSHAGLADKVHRLFAPQMRNNRTELLTPF